MPWEAGGGAEGRPPSHEQPSDGRVGGTGSRRGCELAVVATRPAESTARLAVGGVDSPQHPQLEVRVELMEQQDGRLAASPASEEQPLAAIPSPTRPNATADTVDARNQVNREGRDMHAPRQ